MKKYEKMKGPTKYTDDPLHGRLMTLWEDHPHHSKLGRKIADIRGMELIYIIREGLCMAVRTALGRRLGGSYARGC